MKRIEQMRVDILDKKDLPEGVFVHKIEGNSLYMACRPVDAARGEGSANPLWGKVLHIISRTISGWRIYEMYLIPDTGLDKPLRCRQAMMIEAKR